MEITIDDIIKVIRVKKLCLEEDLVRKYLKLPELSEEESSRIFTPSELRQLCLRRQCKVDMWKWNPVDEVRERLEKQGRFNNHSSEYCLNLIAATTDKYKRKLRYKDKDIHAVQKEDWCIRKRQSIRLLRLWSSNLDLYSSKPDCLQSKLTKHLHCKNKSNTCQTLDDSYRLNVDLKLLKGKTARNLHPSSFDKFSNNISLTSTQVLNSDVVNKVLPGVEPQKALLEDKLNSRVTSHLNHYKKTENSGEHLQRKLLSSFAIEEIRNQKNMNYELLQLFDKISDSESISFSFDTELTASYAK